MVQQAQPFDDEVIGNGQRGRRDEAAGGDEVERGHPAHEAHPRVRVCGRGAQHPVEHQCAQRHHGAVERRPGHGADLLGDHPPQHAADLVGAGYLPRDDVSVVVENHAEFEPVRRHGQDGHLRQESGDHHPRERSQREDHNRRHHCAGTGALPGPTSHRPSPTSASRGISLINAAINTTDRPAMIVARARPLPKLNILNDSAQMK